MLTAGYAALVALGLWALADPNPAGAPDGRTLAALVIAALIAWRLWRITRALPVPEPSTNTAQPAPMPGHPGWPTTTRV